ncbi:MAG TPA: hypothetical protein ENO24_02110, partial [Chloroflexi bacterium]|nr:hypothetical protein [Chloroflexota bacterium]
MVPRQVGAFALAAFLFLGSVVTARLMVANPLRVSKLGAASPTETETRPAAPPTATSTPTAVSTATPPPPTPTIQSSGTVRLDQSNATAYPLPEDCLIHPTRLAARGGHLFALDSGQLKRISLGTPMSCDPLPRPQAGVDGVVVQELGDFALAGDSDSLLLLDRAGNVFRYFLETEQWRVERLSHAPEASSRQHLVSVSAYHDGFYLLDTNVGQVWRHADGAAEVLASHEE